MKTDEWSFLYCPECASKPGTTPICASCLHNRRAISELKHTIEDLEKTRAPMTVQDKAEIVQMLKDEIACELEGMSKKLRQNRVGA